MRTCSIRLSGGQLDDMLQVDKRPAEGVGKEKFGNSELN
jgi:hypothetical protein